MILPILIAMFACRINRHQDHVIRYLREENRILKAKLKGKRIQLTDTERRRLAVLAHPIDRKDLKDLSTIATPDTLQRWYRRLVVHAPGRKPQDKPLGRPRVAAEIEQLVIRMATENPRWGYRRIQGALSNVGHHIDKITVRNILRRNHIDPAPIRGEASMSWSRFVKLHWEVLEASDFFATRLSRFAHLWSVVTHLGRNLSARGAQLPDLIRHGAMSVPGRGAQQWHALWSAYLTSLDTRCHLVIGKRRPGDGAFPMLRLVLSQPVALQVKASPMQQERSPPGGGASNSPIAVRHHTSGRSASTLRLVSGSRAEGDCDPMLRHYRRTSSGANPFQVAA